LTWRHPVDEFVCLLLRIGMGGSFRHEMSLTKSVAGR
jgi:hypothetical protein